MKRKIILTLIFLFTTSGFVLSDTLNQKVIGLIELPTVFGKHSPNSPPGTVDQADVQTILIYSHPSDKSAIIGRIKGADSVETEESDYEMPAVVVYKIIERWMLIHITEPPENKFGWIAPQIQGYFHPLAELYHSGLCYLKKDWNGVLYERADDFTNFSRIQLTEKKQDINVVQSREYHGVLWLEVEILNPGHCGRGYPKIFDRGWVPAHRKNGNLNVWFYSRGC